MKKDIVIKVSFAQMYWSLGKRILEEEQQGKEHPDYGKYLLANLSKKLEKEFRRGFSKKDNLNEAGSFIKCTQLRPNCGHNSTG